MTETTRILQDNEIFKVEIIDWQGKKAVKKTAKTTAPESRVARLKNDVYGMEFFADLAKKHPHFGLCVPEVYELAENYYTREYIEDQPIVRESTPPVDAKPELEKLARLLADIDRVEPYGEVRFVGSSNYRRLHASISEWADENLGAGIISQDQTEKAKQIAANLGEYLRPRIAHGDMSPYKHAYFHGGQIALIDFENFTPEAARYFDVAWSYTRLWSFAVSTDVPKQFLASFLDHAEPAEHREEQLFAVILQRTLGMQYDAFYDVKNKGLHYQDRAAELLSLILKGDLKLLY